MSDKKREVVGVRFKPHGKVYYFDPAGYSPAVGEAVIIETSRGIEYGFTAIEKRSVEASEIVGELKPIIRIADREDTDRWITNRNLAREALLVCEDKVKEHGLEMRLIDSEYTFDNSKLLFYFTADDRVDFRKLVRDLASIFRTRIELRQIGVRDEAKLIGGVGPCGRECCCASFLSEFHPVSINMAKDQGLSLNPETISGLCGRLLCCLRYEQEGYAENLKRLPKVGRHVITPEGKGVVVSTSTLKALVKVKIEGEDGAEYVVFPAEEVAFKPRRKGGCDRACDHAEHGADR
ncbi:MAG: stage 0 sporulation family protein [Peptoniphilus sp.]|nr:stage 0 sporulation family protein [Peptoniphilus sp.]MDD7363162.1 stage 0 sporulation family protein [Bacillota bacterium]MDY6044514.1 stage 0 sporulation family protein [Peptoniphilus sp.]